ncbi:hypothetical protein PILCRDRAFT_822904, partial [Piloderma croceum F 1598]
QSAPSAPTATTISTLGNPLAAAVAMPVAVPVASSHLTCQSLFVKGVTTTLTYGHHTTVLARLTFDHHLPVMLY